MDMYLYNPDPNTNHNDSAYPQKPWTQPFPYENLTFVFGKVVPTINCNDPYISYPPGTCWTDEHGIVQPPPQPQWASPQYPVPQRNDYFAAKAGVVCASCIHRGT
jgi:hypothetical protein